MSRRKTKQVKKNSAIPHIPSVQMDKKNINLTTGTRSSPPHNVNQTSMLSTNINKKDTRLFQILLSIKKQWSSIAKLWRQGLALIGGTILTSVISILFGFNPLPSAPPIVDFIRKHPISTFIIFLILFIMSILSVPVWSFTEGNRNNLDSNWRKISQSVFTVLPITGYALFASLLIVVLIHPPWCPEQICPVPRLIPITNQHGVHDNNLEMYFTAIQTPAYELSKNPASYNIGNLPTPDQPGSIGVQRIDAPTLSPYRVVLSIHSLQQGQFGMFIENVAIVIKHLPSTPYPLKVWEHGPTLDYHDNLFQIVYNGEREGTILTATYVQYPHLHVQLSPGEADTLALQINSNYRVDVQFQVQITYRIANEAQNYVLTFPQTFEAILTDASNWQVYHLQAGHLIPA